MKGEKKERQRARHNVRRLTTLMKTFLNDEISRLCGFFVISTNYYLIIPVHATL